MNMYQHDTSPMIKITWLHFVPHVGGRLTIVIENPNIAELCGTIDWTQETDGTIIPIGDCRLQMAELPFPVVEKDQNSAASELRRGENIDNEQNKIDDTDGELQEFYLPVTGFFQFHAEELAIVNHPAFQRLSKIYQLGQAHLVYRGATHKRFEHVLGAVAVADKMCRSINENMVRRMFRLPNNNHAPALSDNEVRFIRLSALLHDIGHVAAGHTLEDELNLLDLHDGDDRIEFILDRDDWPGSHTESLRSLIDRSYQSFVPKELRKGKMTPSILVQLIVRKPPKENDKHAKIQATLEGSNQIRFRICQNIVSNTICADLLDYLYRDWYHIGRVRTVEDRLYQYMEVARGADSDHVRGDINPSHLDEFVIRLTSSSGRTRSDGVTAILGLLEWRYELAETVLFHRTKVAAASMLGRALYELWGGESKSELLRRLIDFSDEQMIDYALEECENELKSTKGGSQKPSYMAAGFILANLKNRRLHRELLSYESRKLDDSKHAGLAERFGVHGSDSSTANRYRVARDIEMDFELPPGSVSIYCTDVKPKIADVNIEVDGEVARFSEFEKGKNKSKTKDSLTGGHLSAQLERFSDLWKIQFFLDRDVFEKMDEGGLRRIKRHIKEVVTSVKTDLEEVTERCRSIARDFVEAKIDQGDNGIQFKDMSPETFLAARMGNEVGSEPCYPNGVPCLRNFVKRS